MIPDHRAGARRHRRVAALALALALLACDDDDDPAADPRDAAAITDADVADAPLPNLSPDLERTAIDLAIGSKEFTADSCELGADEACVGAPGVRTLLHFSATAVNLGDADLVVGSPSAANPNFLYSECHDHFHLRGFAEYRLVDAEGGVLVTGRKQAFCLVDTRRVLEDDDVSRQARFGCEYQGIQRGWSDTYESRVPCQFLDVTDVDPGDYVLEIEIDPEAVLADADRSDNLARIPVSLGAEALATPTEACPGSPGYARGGQHRECGWQLATTYACNPGQELRIGCASACNLGSCEGDPMLRVCDADRPDQNCSFPAALAHADDSCGSSCPAVSKVPCPASGSIAVYTAARVAGAASACTVEIAPEP